MSPNRISLARIRELEVTVSWQEAVAVARAAGDASLGTGHGASLDTCHITTAGAVEIVGGTRLNGSLRNPVFSLLSALIEGRPAPDGLRALVAAQKPESDDVLLDFLSEDEPQPDSSQLHDLSFFARPNPELLIGGLASRGIAAADAAALQVTEPVAIDIPPAPEPEEGVHWLQVMAAMREWLARGLSPLALGAGALIVIVAAAWAMSSGEAAGPTPDAAAPPVTTEAAVREAEAPADATELPVARTPEKVTAVDPRPARRADRGRAAGADEARPRRTEVAAAPSRAPAVRTPATPPAVTRADRPKEMAPLVVLPLMTAPAQEPAAYSNATPTALAEPSAAAASPSDVPKAEEPVARASRTIYSAADVDVVPPELVRPQLSSEPRIDTEPSQAEVEVVVNAEGFVTQVRLRTDGELSLNDRMIVAAAKAWVFRPALKDGRPVSYVLRIPVAP